MTTRVVLIRGINVGGKNPVKMADLRALLEGLGCTNVETLLVSGNAIVDGGPDDLARQLEAELRKRFTLHDEAVKVLEIGRASCRERVYHPV